MACSRATVIAGGQNNSHVPDLQTKLSKKIAQLTMVVYQLKTKCDDSERQLTDVTNSYEEEIGVIIRDARAKITEIRKYAQEDRTAAALEAVTVISNFSLLFQFPKACKQLHLEEIEKLNYHISELKRRNKENEEAIVSQFTARMATTNQLLVRVVLFLLVRELSKLRDEYFNRIHEFEEAISATCKNYEVQLATAAQKYQEQVCC